MSMRWRRDSLGTVIFEAIRDQPWSVLACAAALLVFSLLCVHSASYDANSGTYEDYARKQCIWIALGIGAYLLVQLIPYRLLLQGAPLFYVLGLIALGLVFVIGTKINGSRRWFSLGPMRVQPSEFMKLALVLMLAQVVGETGEVVQKIRGWLLPGALTAIPFLLVLKQPDLGTALTFIPVLVAALFVAGARWEHFFGAASLGLVTIPLAWLFVLHDYQKGRILSFLDPEASAQGGAYQQIMSIIAIGAGGITGKGYEQGTQGRLGFCPERHTDFIFAVVGEEWGLLGGLALLFVYGLMLTFLMLLAHRVPDRGGRLLVTGVATIFAMQIAVNVAMNTGCGPITGLTLPMMSYGGSSMLCSALALGVVGVAARQRPGVFGPGRD